MKTSPLCFALLILVSRCLASVDITTTSLPSGTFNNWYSATVSATGGCTPYKWTVVSGALPAGISSKVSYTTTSMLISGVPTAATTYTPTVQVTDCGGTIYKASYQIVIKPPYSVAISTTSLPSGKVSSSYSAAVNALGGCTPYKWSILSGTLPAGVTSTISTTTTSLLLTGTPKTASTYSPTVQVTGCGGSTYKASYTIAIQPSGSVQISTTSLPNGIVGSTYSAAVSATGGCTPYKWSIASGSLPAGVTSTASSTTSSLLLSGTPTTASTYSPTVQVAGCNGTSSADAYTITIQGTINHVVDLSWKASTSGNVAGYNVYRSPDGVNWKKNNVTLIASTLYSDSTIANGSTYYYAATAVDTYGSESAKSPSVKVTVP